MFDVDRERRRQTRSASCAVRDFGELEAVVAEEEIVVGVLAVPAEPPRRSPTASSRPA